METRSRPRLDAGTDRCTRPARSQTTNSASTALRCTPWPARLRRQGILQGSVFLHWQLSRAHQIAGHLSSSTVGIGRLFPPDMSASFPFSSPHPQNAPPLLHDPGS
jgi:hypothetical protein